MSFEIFSYQFVWVSLLVAFLVSVCSGVIGSIIVANKSVFIAGGVAHSAFGGVGLAIFCGFSTSLGALGFSVGVALFLAYAFLYYKERLDALVGASWAFGMAFGVILIDMSEGYNADISSYLFGSILAVSSGEIVAMAIFDIVILLILKLYYMEILSLCYDSEFCALKGFRVGVYVSGLFVVIAIGVVLSMSVAGLILVLALLSIPAYIAHLFSHSLKAMIWLSWGISLLAMWAGFFIAFIYNVSMGACVVLILCAVMAVAMGIKHFKRSKK